MRRGLAAWPAEDVGWQEGRPKPGQGRGSAFELLETSYEGVPSGQTGIRRHNGKSEARGVFRAVPPDVREEYPEQTATALTYTYLSLSQPTGVRSRVRSIPFELVLGAQLLNKLAHATFHPMWLPPGHPGARGGGG